MKRLALGLLAAISVAGFAFAGAYDTYPTVGGAAKSCGSGNGVQNCTVPAGPTDITGNELIPADTGLSAGRSPQTVVIPMRLLGGKVQHEVPLTGASITVAAVTGKLVIDPAGTIATLTVTLPAAADLYDGQTLEIGSSETVTALTLTPGSGTTIAQTPTAITASTTAAYGYKLVYIQSTTQWIRLQ